MTSLQEKEYITNLKNSILISVAAPNDDMSKEILSGAVETVESIDKAIDYGLSILSQIVNLDDAAEATAEKYGISEGRVDIINKFVAEHSDYSFDKLSEYYSPGDVAKRIGYEFSIAESSSEDGKKLWAVLAESLTKNIGNHGAIISIGQSTVTDWINQSEIGRVIKHIATAIIPAA